MRKLLMQLYAWRKRDRPPVSGKEALGIVMAAIFLPKEMYIKELGILMDYLEKRQTHLEDLCPRLLVTSDHLDDLNYLGLVESEHALVAMDDLDTGSRYAWQTTEVDTDPVLALAKRYIRRPPDPRMAFWDEHVERIIRWVRYYNIDGVLNFPHYSCFERLCCIPYFSDRLNQAGISHMTLLREYHYGDVGQLRTRIAAFIETL